MPPSPARDDLAERLVREFLGRRARGEDLSVERFAGEHPEAPDLATRLEAASEAAAGDATLPVEVEERSTVRVGAPAAAAPLTSGGSSETLVLAPGAQAAPVRVIDNRYEVVRVLGEGGFGRVHLVRDRLYRKAGGELRALKTILAVHAAKPEFESRFQNEIRVLRALAHDGIPQIYNDGRTSEGEYYYTMAYVEGRTLADVLKTEAPLEAGRILSIVRKLLAVLEYAHKKGVVHRDLKPANVMLVPGARGEEVKVLDFGIAKILRQEGELEGVPTLNTLGGIGTPHYMSPEQVRGREVDTRTDLYALGVMIYQMCTGRLPFRGKTDLEVAAARLESPPAPLGREQAPDWLRDVVMQLLERDKQKRPSTADLQERFEALGTGQRRLRRQLRRAVLAVAALALAAIALSLAIRFWPENAHEDESAGAATNGSAAPHALTLKEPAPGAHFRANPVRVSGTAAGARELEVRGQTVAVAADGTFAVELTLPAEETSEISFRDPKSDRPVGEPIRVTLDSRAPTLAHVTPTPDLGHRYEDRPLDFFLRANASRFAVEASDEPPGELATVELDGVALERGEDGTWVHDLSLGALRGKEVTLRARDRAGNELVKPIRVTLDAQAPRLQFANNAITTADAVLEIRGRVLDDHPWAAHVSGASTRCAQDGSFALTVNLQPGPNNSFRVEAEDAAGNRSSGTFTATRR